ncbi:hypothetical protein FNF29_05026 [Cafeteria roenbergensis]|uniref:DNA mismatch repair protein MutS core domain-containing protein n=1 Tax=Cafeteria roenbergensis TaxID=33653 RepID=A0A5A8CDF0_CAFRO|nr:hypothetical protein FNF29_05026 [Cafeteria roenbergensis]|eukprot:KAA0150689.1 hypothetical protein FNF29_05026 [Cafeteria roenbergensis]
MAAGADIVGSDRVVLSVALVGESAGLVRLGAAAHDASDASVSVTSVATTDSDLPWALELVKAQCGVGFSSRQVTIVASRSARADVLALLAAPLEAEGSGGDPFHVVCRPARAFSEGAALRGLLDARILELEEGVPSSRSRAERSRLLAATIDTGDVAAMQALGGLLDYLGASNAPSSKRMARATSAAALTLSCVREFSLVQTLAMDVATAVGLGVIDALGTGSAGGQVSSLEALLSRAGSATGRRILRQWLLRPSTDVELLNKRLDAVEEAKSAMRLSAGNVTALRKALRSNVHDVVGRLCVALSEQLAACSAGGSQQPPGFGGAATDDEARTGPFLASIGSTILEAEGLSRVFRLLDTVFEFDTMSRSELRDAVAEHVVPIRSGVDQTLDDLRRLQQDVPHFLESTLQTLASKHAQLSGAALEFIPQLGYLVALDSKLDGEPTWVPDEFEHVFDASERRFFRCAESLELDETVGDVHSMLHEREQAILRSIEGHVLEHQAELCMLSEAIGELDVILALAEVAADCGYIRPTLTRDARIELRDCRHPLAEMSLRDGDEFIPNTIVLGGSDPPIILLSGPNGSGKSVLLKQLGLIVVLAQIGSFVPAREATIGIVDRLFSKIRARDT